MESTLPWRELASPSTRKPAEVAEALSDESRIERLFDRHHQRLYRLALRMTSDPEEARDLVQDSFLRIARSPDRVPEGESGAEAWLVRTLVNLCRDRHRRLATRERWAWKVEERFPLASSSESAVVAKATVERAMSTLPPRRRAVLVLCELEERPVADVAEALGLSKATVRWHLSIARKEIARRLGVARGNLQ